MRTNPNLIVTEMYKTIKWMSRTSVGLLVEHQGNNVLIARFCTAAMLHGRNNENILHKNEHFSPKEKKSIVPAMQHGCRAKPLNIVIYKNI